nr:kinase [Sphingomonas metalli]
MTDHIAGKLAQHPTGRPLVIGLCGAQGSGKSTLAARLAARFPDSAVLSLDDLYLPRAARAALAASVHPLFATRGVPGTHDVALGLDIFARLDAGLPVSLPRFDKAADDRVPAAAWPRAAMPCRLILFEGWCVGARAQADEALARPVNALEASDDRDGAWRYAVNAALAGDYARLFARIDDLVLLAAPDWPTVPRWRREQERALRQRTTGIGIMDEAALIRFVAHYERLTRWILDEMPLRALTLRLDAERRLRAVEPPPHVEASRR